MGWSCVVVKEKQKVWGRGTSLTLREEPSAGGREAGGRSQGRERGRRQLLVQNDPRRNVLEDTCPPHSNYPQKFRTPLKGVEIKMG